MFENYLFLKGGGRDRKKYRFIYVLAPGVNKCSFSQIYLEADKKIFEHMSIFAYLVSPMRPRGGMVANFSICIPLILEML